MIIRRKVNSNYTVVPNAPVNDERLTFEGLGLLTYLLSRPDHWRVHLNQLRARGHVGKDKIQSLVRELISCGYVLRLHQRDQITNRFKYHEYVVYDEPQSQSNGQRLSEASVGEELETNDPQPGKPQPEKPAPENAAALVSTEYSNTLRESSASSEAGADAPTVSAKVWREGRELLNQSLSRSNPSIIGKWLKQTPGSEAKEKLLAIIREAVGTGTADPIAYVTQAVNKVFPSPPDPREFTTDIWKRNIQAATSTGAWEAAWGPAPGAHGCLVPVNLVTPNVKVAIARGPRS